MNTSDRRVHAVTAARDRRGFSLLEVVVALTLLASVLGGLGLLSVRSSARARAMDLVAKRNYALVRSMNRYQALPYDSLTAHLNGEVVTLDTLRDGGYIFVRTDSVYTVGGDTRYYEVKVKLKPKTTDPLDSLKKDSLILHRRKPGSSPLFMP